jgi:hypothetical protein
MLVKLLVLLAAVLLGACATHGLGKAAGPERTWVKTSAKEWQWRDGESEIRATELASTLFFDKSERCPPGSLHSLRSWSWKAGHAETYAATTCAGQKLTVAVRTLETAEVLVGLPAELKPAYQATAAKR